MEFYLSGKNNFGPERPIIGVEYRQKRLEIASERDKDLSEFATYSQYGRKLPSTTDMAMQQIIREPLYRY